MTGPQQLDRLVGSLVGAAVGDALGAPYEFQPPRINGEPVAMVGGGAFGWAPGEWTDDTSMALVIAHAILRNRPGSLTHAALLDDIVWGFVEWAATAPDVGVQTGGVLREVAELGRHEGVHRAAQSIARSHFERSGSTGNGSLMRTAPVALALLEAPPAELRSACDAISSLTHGDGEAGEACYLWCRAIQHAVIHGNLSGLTLAVEELVPQRAALWRSRLREAELREPHEFESNGWVVAALQAAWSAVCRADSFASGVEAAVRAGNDTDTVASIAGALLGARWGVSAVPFQWRRGLHGWPVLTYPDLVTLALGLGAPEVATQTLAYSRSDYLDSRIVRHPHDEGVWIGAVNALDRLPADIDAVVSLCRVDDGHRTCVTSHGVRPSDHIEVWLKDSSDPRENPNLEFVMHDAVDAIAQLRSEGRTVYVHCVRAESRTPSISALYAIKHLDVPRERALAEVADALGQTRLIEPFAEVIRVSSSS